MQLDIIWLITKYDLNSQVGLSRIKLKIRS